MEHTENSSQVQKYFLDILQNLQRLEVDNSNLPKWKLLEGIISQFSGDKGKISTLVKEGKINPDKRIDVDKLFSAYHSEEKLKKEFHELKEETTKQSILFNKRLEEQNTDMEIKFQKKKKKFPKLEMNMKMKLNIWKKNSQKAVPKYVK